MALHVVIRNTSQAKGNAVKENDLSRDMCNSMHNADIHTYTQ